MRKRRTRYQWLFNTGSTGPAAGISDTSSGREFSLAVNTNGTSVMQVTDLLNDTPGDDEPTRGLPMGVYQNNEYVIKRIVGKFFLEAQQTAASTGSAFLVGAGIFVARADDADRPGGNANQPVGFGAGTDTLYGPLNTDVIREPWIWRRTWVLTNQLATGGNPSMGSFPRNTAEYGSIQDGSHIDAKTARRVKEDERLFAIIQARAIPLNGNAVASLAIRGYIDYRVLGAMRKGHNRGAF